MFSNRYLGLLLDKAYSCTGTVSGYCFHKVSNSPYSANKKNEIDALASSLNKLVEQFIVYEELEEDIHKKKDYGLAKFFEKTGNPTRFWAVIRKFRKDWDNLQQHSSQDFMIRAQIEELSVCRIARSCV